MRQPIDYYQRTLLDRFTEIPLWVRLPVACVVAFLIGYWMVS